MNEIEEKKFYENPDLKNPNATDSSEVTKNTNETPVLSFLDWLKILLLLSIPCVNIIILIVWALDNTGNVDRRNYCRAMLVFTVLATVLAFLIYFFLIMFAYNFNSISC